MYGVIFDFLREYVIDRHGGQKTWESLLKANGYGYKIYFPVTEYPDEEIVNLATTASEALKLPLPTVLEDFGAFAGKRLLSFYHMYIRQAEWRTFDIIEHAGSSIHDAVHRHNNSRKPPLISAERLTNNKLIVHYQSERKLCPVVKGIIRGLGEHFGEAFNIQESQCMFHGADKCVMTVTRIQ